MKWDVHLRKHRRGTVTTIYRNLHSINYDDGDQETLNLNNGTWRPPDRSSSSSVYAGPKIQSNEQDVLTDIMDAVGNKSFMKQHVEGYQQPVFIMAYQA